MIAVDEKTQEEVFNKLERLVKFDTKKYVRYSDATVMFSLGRTKLNEIAKAAKAIRKIDYLVLINVQVLYDYIENMYS